MKAAHTNIPLSLRRCFNKNFRFLTRRISMFVWVLTSSLLWKRKFKLHVYAEGTTFRTSWIWLASWHWSHHKDVRRMSKIRRHKMIRNVIKCQRYSAQPCNFKDTNQVNWWNIYYTNVKIRSFPLGADLIPCREPFKYINCRWKS